MSQLEYKNKYLGPLEKEHLSAIKKWRNEQMDVLRQYAPLSDFDQKRWRAHIRGDKSQILFALLEKKGGNKQLIGYCGLTNIDLKNRRAELSFLVNPLRAAKKNVYEKDFISALHMLSSYAFEELSLHKLITDTFAFRKDHLAVLEHFGFRKEGTMRDHYFGKGRFFDSHIHSLLAEGWKTPSKKYASKK